MALIMVDECYRPDRQTHRRHRFWNWVLHLLTPRAPCRVCGGDVSMSPWRRPSWRTVGFAALGVEVEDWICYACWSRAGRAGRVLTFPLRRNR